MLDDMGTFRIDVEIENPAQPEVRRAFDKVLVGACSRAGPAPP